MPKFFVARENITENIIRIDSEDAGHISRVLRLDAGDFITVCDGRGIDYEAKITDITSQSVVCRILSKRQCDTEPDIKITLYQGLPKASKMDYIIQKTTELGICRIVPVKMSRCVVKLADAKDANKKTERWQKIAYEAAKQSGRGVIPEISAPVTVSEMIGQLGDFDIVFAPYECEREIRLCDVIKVTDKPKSIAFIIGPEGGFDFTEIEMLKSGGIQTVTLGKRILRTETAGEATLAMLMYGLGEI